MNFEFEHFSVNLDERCRQVPSEEWKNELRGGGVELEMYYMRPQSYPFELERKGVNQIQAQSHQRALDSH